MSDRRLVLVTPRRAFALAVVLAGIALIGLQVWGLVVGLGRSNLEASTVLLVASAGLPCLLMAVAATRGAVGAMDDARCPLRPAARRLAGAAVLALPWFFVLVSAYGS